MLLTRQQQTAPEAQIEQRPEQMAVIVLAQLMFRPEALQGRHVEIIPDEC